MASNWEQIQHNGVPARKYPDGSIRNEKGQMLQPIPGKHTITQADASKLASRRYELKRKIIAEAANEAVQRGDFRLAYGDMAYVAEIGYNAQLKAQNVDDPKQIDAARFLLQETGISEVQAKGETPTADSATVQIFIAQYIASLSSRPDEQLHDTIDGEVTE